MDYHNLFRLDGKVAILPGGYGGIGSALALGLAQFGADVVVAGRHEDRAHTAADEIARETGRQTLGMAVDVVDPGSVEQLVRRVMDRFGRIDILVNLPGRNLEAPAEHFPLDQWKQILEINVTGTFVPSQAVGRVMIAQRTGSIINFSSVRGQLALRGRGYGAYTPAKGAVNNLTRQLAAEWAPHDVRVNAIAPTFIETQQVAHMLADPAFRQSLVDRIPLGRIGQPRDLVGATVFLASPASAFITGQVFLVDGGLTATQ